MTAPFTPDVVTAVARHMNGDHAADCLRICRALGGAPGATDAVMTGMDPDGLEFTVTADDGTRQVARVPWGVVPADRGAVRVEVVRLHDEACALLGETPEAHGTH